MTGRHKYGGRVASPTPDGDRSGCVVFFLGSSYDFILSSIRLRTRTAEMGSDVTLVQRDRPGWRAKRAAGSCRCEGVRAAPQLAEHIASHGGRVDRVLTACRASQRQGDPGERAPVV
jgi:hypothetical protein